MVKYFLVIAGLVLGTMLPYNNSEAAADKPVAVIADESMLEEYLYQQLLMRNTLSSFIWLGESDAAVNGGEWLADIMPQVYERDKATSDDFDYLLYNVKSYEISADNIDNRTIFKVQMAYRESAAELNKVNSLVSKALTALKLSNDSAGTKIRKIHDFIIRQTKYSRESVQGSAYEAIVMGRTDSRGYALLADKMLTEAGVPCRIVNGTINGEAVFWNIVKLDNMWYHLDLVHDDGDDQLVPVRYNYFLRGSIAMNKDHALADDYQMVEFEVNQPLAAKDYHERNKLILAADAAIIRDKTGVGAFNEIYAKISDGLVDPIERLNEAVANVVLEPLQDVFMGL